jgi:hypothetical protein
LIVEVVGIVMVAGKMWFYFTIYKTVTAAWLHQHHHHHERKFPSIDFSQLDLTSIRMRCPDLDRKKAQNTHTHTPRTNNSIVYTKTECVS